MHYSLFPAIVVVAVAFSISLRAADKAATPSERSALDYVRLGDSLMQQSRDTLDSTRYQPARGAYEHALALDPQYPAAMVGLAWVCNSEHNFDDGARWCNAALALDENLPSAYALLADGAVELGRYNQALDWCQRALDLRPDLSSYSRAAHVLWITGHPARAREFMKAAIAAGGGTVENTAWCEAQLATMLLNSNQTDAAGRLVDDALVLAPRNPHLLLVAARVTAARGDFAGAIELHRRGIAIAPTHDALADLVDLFELTGQVDEARRQFARVLAFHASQHSHASSAETAKDRPQPHFHGNAELAQFLADRGRMLEVAVGEAEAAYDAAPNVAAADTLAWCYYRADRITDAEAAIRNALAWNSPLPELHFHAAMIFARAGSTELTRGELERALALNREFHPRFADEAREMLRSLDDAGS